MLNILGAVLTSSFMTSKEKDLSTDDKINNIVDYIVKIGTENTESGQYSIQYTDIESKFPWATEDWLTENHELIKMELDEREEILSETWDEYDYGNNKKVIGFDCNFCGNYCPNWIE